MRIFFQTIFAEAVKISQMTVYAAGAAALGLLVEPDGGLQRQIGDGAAGPAYKMIMRV
jgi:hypothetical protein